MEVPPLRLLLLLLPDSQLAFMAHICDLCEPDIFISTYYHQTSVIYFYGFTSEMKLNWAVLSVIHSWT